MSVRKRFAGWLGAVLAAACALLMALLAVLVIAAVIARELSAAFSWYDEIAAILLVWITYMGAALAALRRAHLGFPNLLAAAAPPLRVPLTLLAEAVTLTFFVTLAWYGWRLIVLLEGDTLTSLPWVPVPVSQSIIPLGAALFVLAELCVLPDRLHEARHGLPPPAEAELGGEPTHPEDAR